jgi:ABC-type Fe3+ transport system permease subunit
VQSRSWFLPANPTFLNGLVVLSTKSAKLCLGMEVLALPGSQRYAATGSQLKTVIPILPYVPPGIHLAVGHD